MHAGLQTALRAVQTCLPPPFFTSSNPSSSRYHPVAHSVAAPTPTGDLAYRTPNPPATYGIVLSCPQPSAPDPQLAESLDFPSHMAEGPYKEIRALYRGGAMERAAVGCRQAPCQLTKPLVEELLSQ